jgi:syntaxin 1B/2/3
MSKLAELKALRNTNDGDVAVDIKEETSPVELEKLNTQPAGDAEYVKQFEKVKTSLNKIEKNTEKIIGLKNRADVEVKDSDQKEIMNELDHVMLETKNEATKTKELLALMEKENKDYEAKNPSSTNALIRSNLLATHTRHFNNVMREFQDASESFRDSLRQRIARQVRIVKEDVTQEEIDKIIQSDDPGKYLKEAMGLTDILVDAVAELEERHEKMKQIEQGVREVLELFQDLATLVELQQEHLDNIEQNVAKSKNYTQQAEQELIKAKASQDRARKWQCYALILALVVLGVIIGVIVVLKK